jgi:hypothetical protein
VWRSLKVFHRGDEGQNRQSSTRKILHKGNEGQKGQELNEKSIKDSGVTICALLSMDTAAKGLRILFEKVEQGK